jgi:hypothetical protein
MRIAVAADSTDGVAAVLVDELGRRGHKVLVHGALAAGGGGRDVRHHAGALPVRAGVTASSQ